MDYAHKRGIVTCISTNGTLIDKGIAERLDKHLVYVQVSLDGATEASNDRIRGRGSFAKVMAALEHLRKRSIEVSINTVLTRLSFPELDDLVELAAGFGAKLRVSRFRPSGRGKDSWKELNVNSRQLLNFSDWLGRHLAVSTGDSFFSVSTEERRSLGLNMCGACKLTCCLSPEGNIFPCAFLQEPEFRAEFTRVSVFSAAGNQILRKLPTIRHVPWGLPGHRLSYPAQAGGTGPGVPGQLRT
jgi:MoaA/NifB/PqqE/SkfB family radical SAM enzyme